jgi:hypothetical protein
MGNPVAERAALTVDARRGDRVLEGICRPRGEAFLRHEPTDQPSQTG